MKHNQKNCYIIAGPNGAGKTTFAMKYLPILTKCQKFINADMIAAGLSPLNPELSQIKASRIFLNEIKISAKSTEDFAFETTLSGKTYVRFINNMKENHWNIHLIYLWIPNVEFSELRVKERVLQGGHNIPVDAIQRRYKKTISNLFNLYMPICDTTLCFDHSFEQPYIIFENNNNLLKIYNKRIYKKMEQAYDK